MNKISLYITGVVLAFASLFSSCEDSEFLDKTPSGELTEDQVWSSFTNTKYFYYDTYNFLRSGLAYMDGAWMDAATDLAVMSRSSCGTNTSFNVGNFYDGGGSAEISDTWERYYRGIRKVNLFMANIDSVPKNLSDTEETYQTQMTLMKAEMRFLRAYFYWELALRYGPIPLITDAIDPDDELADILAQYARPESEKEVFQYIISELDSCYNGLYSDSEISNSELGKITKGTNLALKSRIVLYLASPYYQDLGMYTWQDAADMAKTSIDSVSSNFGFFKYTTSTNLEVNANNYKSAINTTAYNSDVQEVIFWKNLGTGDWWQNESPVSFGGYGGLCPSQTLVDMYDMADGSSPFTEYDATGAPVYDVNGNPQVNNESSYDPENPYDNRDPRMYATVLYNGAEWWNTEIETFEGGADKPIGNAYATPTSYYNIKFHDDTQTDYTTSDVMSRNWIFIRYPELLLNYAEALNEAEGPSDKVFDILQQIRNRVGMTSDLSTRSDLSTKDGLRNFIHKERSIELVFENHRWWDVRRWKVSEKAIGRPLYGMTITQVNDSTFTYERSVAQERVFQDRFYLYPIPEGEIWKTDWTNNSGWEH